MDRFERLRVTLRRLRARAWTRLLHLRVRLVLARRRWRNREQLHMLYSPPRYVSGDMGECLTCGKPRARANERCSMRRWYATRPATTLCGKKHEHRRAVLPLAPFVVGCEICDRGARA